MSKRNKKIFIIIIIAVVVIIGIGIPLFLTFYNNTLHGKVMINGHVIKVEIANTPETRMKGLSGREKLGKDEGMLFVMDEKRYHTFWMADMKFPIDIIWISDNKVIDLTKNASIPVTGEDIPVFKPAVEVDKVLEVNAGYIDANNIQLGDEVGIDY
jgi:uncharacterized membrane protein (UPF0127 family)